MKKSHIISAMKTALLPAMLSLGICHCPGEEIRPYEPQPVIHPPAAIQSDAFALDIFRSLAKEQQGNIAFSPASLESALCLLRQGAAGRTADEFDSLPLGDSEAPTAMQPIEATALFLEEGISLKPGIKAEAIQQVPFSDAPDKAAEFINKWAERNTKGIIKCLISSGRTDPGTRLFAANAICLQEKWLRPFKPEETAHDAPFRCADGSIAKVDMMRGASFYLYAEGEDWKAIALFYRTDGRPGTPGCFIGILPQGDARSFAAGLTERKFSAIRQALAASDTPFCIVKLPSFSCAQPAISFKKALKDNGLNKAFTPSADFSGFSDNTRNLNISDVKQICHVEANEKGTVAIAVTGSGIGAGACRIITFDRPFIWVICDLVSAAPPYFMGLYEHP